MTWHGLRKRGIHVLAPVLAAALLLASLFIGGVNARPVPGRAAYFARVKDAVEQIPYAIGDWRGENEEIVQAARRLLKPTAAVQRRYVSAGGPNFSLLMIHCADVRDMEGHYPPICYPNQGWAVEERRAERVTVGEADVPMRRYVLSREMGLETQRIVIWNVFVLPGEEPLVDDMPALTRAARSTRRAGLGSAQIQVLLGAGVEGEREIVERCLRAVMPAIRTIAEGTEHEQPS